MPGGDAVNLRTCTIEDVAEACGHRMTHTLPTPLISREPCERCADLDTEASTGAPYCKASPSSGDFECESYREVREYEDLAMQAAAQYKRLSNPRMRGELATSTAEGYANALHEQGLGAEFDTEAFLELAGCGRDDR